MFASQFSRILYSLMQCYQPPLHFQILISPISPLSLTFYLFYPCYLCCPSHLSFHCCLLLSRSGRSDDPDCVFCNWGSMVKGIKYNTLKNFGYCQKCQNKRFSDLFQWQRKSGEKLYWMIKSRSKVHNKEKIKATLSKKIDELTFPIYVSLRSQEHTNTAFIDGSSVISYKTIIFITVLNR